MVIEIQVQLLVCLEMKKLGVKKMKHYCFNSVNGIEEK